MAGFSLFRRRAAQLSLFSKNRRRWPKDGKSGHGTLWNRSDRPGCARGREARKPQRFRPAQQLQQPSGRSGGVPRPFSVALRLVAPQHRACGDDSERRGGSSRVPRPVRAAACSSAGGRGAADSAAAQPAARLLLEIYRAYFLPGASLGSSGAVRLEQACFTPGAAVAAAGEGPAFSSPQQQGCHPPPAPRRRSASRPDPRS